MELFVGGNIVIDTVIYLFMYLILAFIVFYKSKFAGFGKNQIYENCISLNVSQSLKGIFAIVIVMHHLSLHYFNDRIMLPFMQAGKYAVSAFFLLSGIGLMYSFLHKENYLKQFISHRLSKILIPSVLATIAYLIFDCLTGNKTEYNFLKIITGKDTIVMYSWFVYQIVLIYLVFYIVFRNIKNIKLAIIAFVAFTLIDMICFTLLGYDLYWEIGILCVSVGVVFVYEYDRIVEFFRKNYYISLILSGVIFVVSFVVMAAYLQEIENKSTTVIICELLVTNISCISFSVLLILVLLKFSFVNKITIFFGKISFEIYLFHGLVLTAISCIKGLPNSVIWLLVILVTVLVSAVANQCSKFVFKLLRLCK